MFGMYGITLPKYITSTIAKNFCVINEFKNICVVFMYLLDGSENNEVRNNNNTYVIIYKNVTILINATIKE